MTRTFNPPPNWPEPPSSQWVPPRDFRPLDAWGPVPSGWRLWAGGALDGSSATAPLQASEDVPASGARPRERTDTYPVSVINPGMWSQNHLQDEDYGFPPARPRTERPRLRLGLTITATALGFVIAALVIVGFVGLVQWSIDEAPGYFLEEVTGMLSSIGLDGASVASSE